MGIFKKTEKEESVKAQAEAPQEKKEEKQEAQAARFSTRAAGIFGSMYRLIVSVNLQANVCQIESGSREFAGGELPLRLHYTDLISYMAARMYPQDKEAFAEDFAPQNLAAALSSPDAGFKRVYCLSNEGPREAVSEELPDPAAEELGALIEETEESDSGLNYSYYEFRADNIPAPGELQTRCIIYVREVSAKPANQVVRTGIKGSEMEEEAAKIEDLNKVRIDSFFGGMNVIFLEYNTREDIMLLHNGAEADAETTEIKNYMRNLSARIDWSISHSSLSTVKSLMESAKKGIPGSGEVLYRINGAKDKKFRYFRFSLAPVGSAVPPEWIVGTLEDVDDEVKERYANKDIASHIDQMMNSFFTNIFEIDFDKDLMYNIVKTDDGFRRENRPQSFSAYITNAVESGIVDPANKNDYKRWLEKGFLEHKTLSGNYEFESKLRLPGSTEYRWYSETICKLEGVRRYLRFRRDITDIQEARHKEYQLEEVNRYSEYNRRMLDLMASLVEFRNVESGPHIARVRKLTRIMLEDMQSRSPNYEITNQMVDLYSEAATMHDIGKIVVPDHILNKVGKFTPNEREIMQRHTVDGARIVEKLEMPGQEDLLLCCKDVAMHHHERFDGSGYPDGLVGEETAIGVQVMGLADVYDALVSERCYKEGLSHDDAINMILTGEAGVFNPRLLETFKACKDRMYALYSEDLR